MMRVVVPNIVVEPQLMYKLTKYMRPKTTKRIKTTPTIQIDIKPIFHLLRFFKRSPFPTV